MADKNTDNGDAAVVKTVARPRKTKAKKGGRKKARTGPAVEGRGMSPAPSIMKAPAAPKRKRRKKATRSKRNMPLGVKKLTPTTVPVKNTEIAQHPGRVKQDLGASGPQPLTQAYDKLHAPSAGPRAFPEGHVGYAFRMERSSTQTVETPVMTQRTVLTFYSWSRLIAEGTIMSPHEEGWSVVPGSLNISESATGVLMACVMQRLAEEGASSR